MKKLILLAGILTVTALVSCGKDNSNAVPAGQGSSTFTLNGSGS